MELNSEVDTEALRLRALNDPSRSARTAYATAYVGDQVGRLADAVERLIASGRVPVDATLRSAPEDRLAGPAGI